MKKPIKISDLPPLKESFRVPEGYFDSLMEKIEERKEEENNVVNFRSTRIRIWGAFVAAACVAMVIVSIANFGPASPGNITAENEPEVQLTDHAIVSLLSERDDEFELTEEELIEVVIHESEKSEATAIINYLEDDVNAEEPVEDEFLGSI